jgi:tetratricopeptide (TPR) repeat protein
LLAAVVLAVMACGARPCLAAEPYRVFLRGLWARGYGDAAVDYVQAQRQRSDLPTDVRDTIELDLARSLRIAADEATSGDAAARRLTAARAHLDHFLHEHADHPDLGGAHALMGELALGRGQELLRAAQSAPADVRTTTLGEARQEFEAARPNFAKAARELAAQLAAMPAPPPPAAEQPAAPATHASPARKPAARARAKTTGKAPPLAPAAPPPPVSAPKTTMPTERTLVEEQWLDATFKSVIIDYYLAQTFGAADEFSRQEALKAAAQGFDRLYQRHRLGQLGLAAHFWHGRVEEQLGNPETALDIYDEVLAIVPEDGDRQLAPEVMDLLCQAEGRRLQLLDKLGDRDTAITEAQQWLEQFNSERRSPGNLEIALQLCKLKLAKANTLTGDERRELTRSALTALTEITKLPGGHQREAVLLWRKHQGNGEPEVGTDFSEALAVAEASARNGLWDEAIDGYGRAIRLARGSADGKQLRSARLDLARAQFFAGKLDDAISTADELARDPQAADLAPAASLLAVSAACKGMAIAAPAEKAAAEARAEKLAALVVDHWPSSAQADEARLILARLKLAHDDLAGSLPLLEKIGPTSEQSRTALYLIGQIYWKLHLDQPKPSSDKSSTAAPELKAVAALEALIGAEGKTPADGGPLPEDMRDAMVLLAEIRLALGQPAQAAPLVERLIASVKQDGGRPPDAAGMRTFAVAMKVYIANHQLAKAHEAAALLLDAGPDQRQVNSALVDYVRLVKTLPDDKRPAATGATGTQTTASLQLAGLLDKLAGRKEFSLSDRVYLGTVCRDLSRRAQAVAFLQGALRQAEQELHNPTPQMLRVLTQVRLLVVDLLRAERRYAEASSEADQLIRDNPRVLEPMIHQAQVLQDWSSLKPDKFPDAVAAWMRVRNALQGMQPKPAEYYDAVYNMADCLFRQARESHDDKKLLQAEQALKATLALYPKLHGPESVGKFQELLARIVAARPAATPAQ